MLYLTAVIDVAAIYIRPAEIVPSLATVPVMDVLTVVSLLVAIGSMFVRPRLPAPSGIDGYVLLFWLAIVLSNLSWGWSGGAYKGLLDFAPIVFCYFLIRFAVDTPERLRRFVAIFIALNVFLAVNGIVQFHTGLGLGNTTTVGAENRIRGTGIFNDPNDLAMTLVMTVPFLLWFIVDRGCRLWQRGLAIVLLAPILVAIVYTNSRGAVLGLGAAVCVFAMRQFKLIPALTFAAAAAAAIVLAGPARVQALDSQETSAQSRIEAWGDGLMMVRADPIFGVGYGRFTEYHYQVAHNSFVQAAAELGMLGAVVLVGMFATLFRTLKIARQAPSRPEALPASWINAMGAASWGMVVCCFFLSRQYVVVPYIMLALGGSAGWFVPGPRRAPPFPPLVESVFMALAFTLVTMMVVYGMVRTMGAW